MYDWSSKHAPFILDKFHLCLPGWEHLSGCTVHHCINESKWSHRLAMLTECLYVYIHLEHLDDWYTDIYLDDWYHICLPENSDSNWTWRLQPSKPSRLGASTKTALLRCVAQIVPMHIGSLIQFGGDHGIFHLGKHSTARVYPGAVKKIWEKLYVFFEKIWKMLISGHLILSP